MYHPPLKFLLFGIEVSFVRKREFNYLDEIDIQIPLCRLSPLLSAQSPLPPITDLENSV
jgi:hypothetical protein